MSSASEQLSRYLNCSNTASQQFTSADMLGAGCRQHLFLKVSVGAAAAAVDAYRHLLTQTVAFIGCCAVFNCGHPRNSLLCNHESYICVNWTCALALADELRLNFMMLEVCNCFSNIPFCNVPTQTMSNSNCLNA